MACGDVGIIGEVRICLSEISIINKIPGYFFFKSLNTFFKQVQWAPRRAKNSYILFVNRHFG